MNSTYKTIAKFYKQIKNSTTVGHTGSNACGDDKVHFSSVKKKKVVVKETRKVLTKVIS